MKALTESTKQTYRYCLERWYNWTSTTHFTKWEDEDLDKSVLSFIDYFDRANLSPRWADQHVSALCWRYGKKLRTDAVKERLAQLRIDKGQPAKKAYAIGIEELTAMVRAVTWQRDKTILTVGWAGALRASEIIAIRRNDIAQAPQGLELMIRRSKTDQTGKGKKIALPYFHQSHAEICPARNLGMLLIRQAELFSPLPKDDRIFPITTRTITRIVNRAGWLARLPAPYSAHSLRRGLATTAAQHNIDDRTIMRHGRWSSREMVDEYVEEGTLWSRTALDFLR